MVNQPLRPQPQAKPVATALPVETRGRAAAGQARLGSLFAVRRSHRNVGAVVLEIVVVHHTERLPADLQAAQCGLRCVNGVRATGAWRTPQRTRRRIARLVAIAAKHQSHPITQALAVPGRTEVPPRWGYAKPAAVRAKLALHGWRVVATQI